MERRRVMEHLKTYPAFPGWYADVSWPGEAHIYKMEKILFHGKSEFQELLVFEVLLVGGGDGGILREISRHSSVEHIDICEIDKMVIHVYKKFFPDIAVGYEDPRMHVHIRDGVAFINSVPEGTYDVIILDAFPAMGHSADVLADKCFLESIAKALRPRGVLLWHTNSEVADTIANCKIFKGSVNYAWATVPAYVSGAIGFMLCSTEGPPVNFKHPINKLNPEKNGVAKGPPKFYNSEIHAAAFFCGQGWLIQQDIHK
ncbi:hypothetical protein JHK85_012008 [Glycine max]|nr:hypothetical protein JHK85_012008 [Glycine max]